MNMPDLLFNLRSPAMDSAFRSESGKPPGDGLMTPTSGFRVQRSLPVGVFLLSMHVDFWKPPGRGAHDPAAGTAVVDGGGWKIADLIPFQERNTAT